MTPDLTTAFPSIERALKFAQSNEIRDKKERDDYWKGYPALCRLFREKLDYESSSDIWIGAYSVYGWMPTMMKGMEQEGSIESLRSFAITWKNKTDRKQAIQALREGQVDLRTINNSVVGTSKFLHFVAPEIFPIWDSRIETAFNQEYSYPDYCNLIHTYLERDIDWPDWMRGDDSNVRKLEFCLFQHGKFLDQEAKLKRIMQGADTVSIGD